MKKDLLKKILFYFIASVIIIIIPNLKKEKVNAAISGKTGEELGYAVNVVNYHNAYGYNMGAPILDEDFLRTLVATSNNNKVETENIYKTTSFLEINKKRSNEMKMAIDTNASYDIYTGSTNYAFKNLLSTDYKCNQSQYYGVYSYEKVIKSLAIPNYAAFSQTYEKNFSKTFIYKLQELGMNLTDDGFNTFFNEFGTHVIVGAKYGGKLESFYSVLSDSLEYTSSVCNTISQQIDLSVANFANVNTSTKLTFSNSQSNIVSNCVYNSSINIRGGITRYANNVLSESGGYINQWKNSISESSAAFIGFTEGGLLPIWRVLPSNFAYLEEPIKEAFIRYVNGYNENIYKAYSYTNTNLKLNSYSDSYRIRTTEKTINDSGRFNNHCDVLNLKDAFGLYLETIKSRGIKKITLKIEFEAREVNDGYQYIFLYSKEKDTSDNKLLNTVDFQLTKDAKQTTFSHEIFELSFSVSDLVSNNIYIRYGASGENEDDWINSDLYVRIMFTEK